MNHHHHTLNYLHNSEKNSDYLSRLIRCWRNRHSCTPFTGRWNLVRHYWIWEYKKLTANLQFSVETWKVPIVTNPFFHADWDVKSVFSFSCNFMFFHECFFMQFYFMQKIRDFSLKIPNCSVAHCAVSNPAGSFWDEIRQDNYDDHSRQTSSHSDRYNILFGRYPIGVTDSFCKKGIYIHLRAIWLPDRQGN